MSQNTSVIVVGAGIVGVSTAIWLQRAGFEVTLLDREGPAAGTSYGNAGILAASAIIPVPVPGIWKKAPHMLFSPNEPLFLRWSYLPKLLPFLFPYLKTANQKDMERIAGGLTEMMHDTAEQHMALAKDTPAERYLVHGDYLYVYDTEEDYLKDAAEWELRRRLGVAFEELDKNAIDASQPDLAGRFGFGIRCGNHGHITDPGAYTKALAEHFEEQGGHIVISEVTDLIIKGDVAFGVKTQVGDLAAGHIVLTTGAWSGAFAKKVGAKLPVESERGYHLEFIGADVELTCPLMVTSKKFAMSSMDGRLRCAGIVEFGGLDAPPSRAPFELIKRNALEIFPDMSYERIDEWMGHRPSTPDSLPLVGEFAHAKNVWAGFGHQHLGLTGGPKTGRWLAQMIAGEKPNTNMDPFAPDRFG